MKPNDILEADFWPEPVRVLTVQTLGGSTKIEAVGTRTQQFYSRIFSAADLERVRRVTGSAHDFQGRAECFFLAIEAHRVRFAQ
ncbi:MAG: hypothetical protein N3I86_07555, partial [Verrucomicrobiae bacterium]|nr:hypothetical protein [Verrucomicrobiae bacterium]